MSVCQVCGKLLRGPASDAAHGIACNVVGSPTLRSPACELASLVHRLHEIARGMAFPAVPCCLHEIGSAVPRWTLFWDRTKALIGVEEGRPEGHQPALIQGKEEGIGFV